MYHNNFNFIVCGSQSYLVGSKSVFFSSQSFLYKNHRSATAALSRVWRLHDVWIHFPQTKGKVCNSSELFKYSFNGNISSLTRMTFHQWFATINRITWRNRHFPDSQVQKAHFHKSFWGAFLAPWFFCSEGMLIYDCIASQLTQPENKILFCEINLPPKARAVNILRKEIQLYI